MKLAHHKTTKVFLLFVLLFSLVTAYSNQTTKAADITYYFGQGLGAADTAGSGYKLMHGKYAVPNLMELWDENIYYNSSLTTGVFELKAQTIGSFTFKDIYLKDSFGTASFRGVKIEVFNAFSSKIYEGERNFPETVGQTVHEIRNLSSLFTSFPTEGIRYANKVVITWTLNNNNLVSNTDFVSYTVADESATGLPPLPSYSFDKYTSSAGYQDVVIDYSGHGFEVVQLSNGGAIIDPSNYTADLNTRTITLKKEYLSTLNTGAQTVTIVFKDTALGAATINISNSTPLLSSTITPTSTSFDKYNASSGYADVVVDMDLQGNTFTSIESSGTALPSNAYEVNGAGDELTLKKEYLSALAEGSHTFTFKFSAGNDATMTVTVSDSTPANSTISPTTVSFDKYAASSGYTDVVVDMDLQGNTFTSIELDGTALPSSAYEVNGAGDELTLKKEYLSTLAEGAHTFTFKFSAGNDATMSVTVSDSTPANSTITPTTASFDKYSASSGYADVLVNMDLQGNTFIVIETGGTALSSSAYELNGSGDELTLKKEYLATLAEGPHTFTFKFSAGNDATLSITVSDSTPANSTISPTTTSFDKYSASSGYADVVVSVDLQGNTFTGIETGGTALPSSAFEMNATGDVILLKKEYLATLAEGPHTFTFKFSAGNDAMLSVTVSDSTPANSTISPTTANFDKNSVSSDYTDIVVSMDLKGNSFASIERSGFMMLPSSYELNSAGTQLTLKKEYLESLSPGTHIFTFKFSAGNNTTLSLTISDSTIFNSTISPVTASFDKYSASSGYADIVINMDLQGNTFSSIDREGFTLLPDSYELNGSGDELTLKKEYLEYLSTGSHTFTFKFSAGNDAMLTVTVSDSTPANSTISPTTATFDKYSGSSDNADIAVSMDLLGNTFASIERSGTALSSNAYEVNGPGNELTLKKEYLATLAEGSHTFTFKFSAGNDATLTIAVSDSTPANSTITPTTVSFDKYSASSGYADIVVSMDLQGNTFSSLELGGTALSSNAYEVNGSGNELTLKKEYLAMLAEGSHTFTFKFSAGNDATMSVTVSDSTPANSTISPTTAAFDKYSGSSDNADIAVSMDLQGNTFASIERSGIALPSSAYEVNGTGDELKLKKEYLATLAEGLHTFTFKFSAGNDVILSVTVSDSTPSNSTITPTTASFDKYVASSDYTDIAVSMDLQGNTFTSIERSGIALPSSAYEVNGTGDELKLKKEYLATLAEGLHTFTFKFSAGNDATLSVTVSDSTPSNSTITPTTATFDKYSASSDYADVVVDMDLQGNTFTSILRSGTALPSNAYEVNGTGDELTLKKEYLATLAEGSHTFTFKFSAGNDATLTVTVSDSTPANSTISPTTASFDKYSASSGYADIVVSMDLQGNTFTGIETGGTALLSSAYEVNATSDVMLLKKEYLATLSEGLHTFTFKFSAGNDATLSVTVSDSTPANSTITPTTASFDKYATSSGYTDVVVSMDLQGNTFTSIEKSGTALPSNAYEVNGTGDELTLKKEYLATLAEGSHTFTFKFSAGNDAALTVTVSDSTPANSTITPTTASFDKYAASSEYADIAVSMDLQGNTFTSMERSGTTVPSSAYELNAAGDELTLKKEYLATLAEGPHTFTFKFNAGNDAVLTVTVSDSTPSNSTITPMTATFDKYSASSDYADVVVDMDLQGNTFTSIEKSGTALPSNAYEVNGTGDELTLKKEYLATLAEGSHTFTFKFSAGNDAALTVTVSDSTPANSTITPTTASFDKYATSSGYTDVVVSMDLQGNTFASILRSGTALPSNAYEVNGTGDELTLKKEFLATLAEGTHTFTFKFSAGNDATLSVTVSDSTPTNSIITPTTASFDKYAASTDYADVAVSMDLQGNTFTSILRSGTALPSSAYELNGSGDELTLKKEYLATLAEGPHTFTFKFNAGNDATLTVSISDSTPANSTISPTTASFNKYAASTDYADIAVSMDLQGNTFTSILRNRTTVPSSAYELNAAGDGLTLKKEYLATLAEGPHTFIFKFSAGNEATLAITVSDSTPGNSTVTPTAASFDKHSASNGYTDITVSINLQGNTFTSIERSGTALPSSVYVLNTTGDELTLKKEYLATLAEGSHTFTFTFSAGNDATLTVTVSDSRTVTPTPTPAPTNDLDISIDDKTNRNLWDASLKTENGKTVTEITLNTDGVMQYLETADLDAILKVAVNYPADKVLLQIKGQLLSKLIEKQIAIELHTSEGTLVWSAGQFNMQRILGQLGAVAFDETVHVSFEINQNPALPTEWINSMPATVGSPLEMIVSYTKGERHVSHLPYQHYAERMIELDPSIDPGSISTAIVIRSDGSYTHVPTKLMQKNGKNYVEIQSLIDGVYAFVQKKETSFVDIQGHWASSAIEAFADRLIVQGQTAMQFAPDVAVTRAEFTAILARALGLTGTKEQATFVDIEDTSWALSPVQAAMEYGLINGYSNGSFRPMQTITREEAIAVITRAMGIMELNYSVSNEEAEQWLQSYQDQEQLSVWAKQGMATALKSGIIQGRTSTILAPKAEITRAEIVIMIERLLKQNELIH
ncbi:X2-like carbohydrate binding domain-containing protein [Paenibacillus montaniterrae]|nr:X2-like carbohydrate binding domain-containing protein [Paenibacillus montaniterrae]